MGEIVLWSVVGTLPVVRRCRRVHVTSLNGTFVVVSTSKTALGVVGC